MKPHPRLGRSLFALAALTLTANGCAGIQVMEPITPSFDSQSCVEAALRHNPDRQSLPMAFDHFDGECSGGDPAACSTLGVMYELGLAAPHNERLAVSLYQRACTAGNEAGCVNLGLAYGAGKGVVMNVEIAVSLLSSTCGDGYGPACGELGLIYLGGKGITQDSRLAASLFEAACEDAHVRSCYELASMYDEGRLKTDTMRKITLYEQACAGGIDPACDRLSGAYATGRNQGPPTHPREDACRLGDATACTAVGLAYYNGDGVPHDVERGTRYLQRACSGGYEPSCAVLRPMLHGSCVRGKDGSCQALAQLVR